jgi:hypothetical protein
MWWRRASELHPTIGGVHPEYAYPGKGIVDLLIETPDSVTVLENKLWEDWHDWSDESRQADRYRAIATQLATQRKKVSRLLLLSAREDLEYVEALSPNELQVPRDYVWISYTHLARALRWEIREKSIASERILEFWPALLTVNAIERCILGLRKVPPEKAGWRDLSQLTRALLLVPGSSDWGADAEDRT